MNADTLLRFTTCPAGAHAQGFFSMLMVQNVLASIVDPARVHCGYRVLSYSEVPDNKGGGVLLHFKVWLGEFLPPYC
eukprot:884114-Pelagomonas_calceolata.AAC.3